MTLRTDLKVNCTAVFLGVDFYSLFQTLLDEVEQGKKVLGKRREIKRQGEMLRSRSFSSHYCAFAETECNFAEFITTFYEFHTNRA